MPLPQGQLLASEETQHHISTRFEQACLELKAKGERQRADKAIKDADKAKALAREEALRPGKERREFMKNQEGGYQADSLSEQARDDDERDAMVEEDDELDAIRAMRLQQLKSKKKEHAENLAKGHGEYADVSEDAFLKTCLASKFAVAHFYHNDFEMCKVMDKHLGLLARKHVETRFFKVNAEKTPFFVEKLSVRTLPTLVFFIDGKAIDRLTGFQGLSNGAEFPTRELEERLGLAGIIKMEREFYDKPVEQKVKPKTSILAKVEDFDDPFA
jgi:thiol-disulfide isomerase/thioredoxin